MNKLKLAIVGGLVAIATITSAPAASAASTGKCSVEAAKLGAWGKAISVSGDTVTASFKVVGTNCTTPVTLAVWERPTAEGINDQKLNNYTTKTFGPGVHTLSAKLPNCMWQADVVEGAKATAADGTANYQYQNGTFVDGGLRDFRKGGSGVCTATTPTTPVNPVTPEKPLPETLPKTGAESVMANAFGLTAFAGVAHNITMRFKKRRG